MSSALLQARNLYGAARTAARSDAAGETFYPGSEAESLETSFELTPISPGRCRFFNRFVALVIAQFNQLPSAKTKEDYAQFLVTYLMSDGPIPCAVLIRVGRFALVAEELGADVRFFESAYENSLQLICDTMRFEPHILAPNEVRALADRIIDRINDIESRRIDRPYGSSSSKADSKVALLAQRLKMFALEVPLFQHIRRVLDIDNPEINLDEKRVQHAFQNLDVPQELQDAFTNLLVQFDVAATDFEFAECISRARAVYEASIIGIAQRLSDLDQNGTRRPIGNMGQGRNRLTEMGIITPPERDFLEGLWGFLSVEGAHSLSAEREQARIAKNILVEVLLFLVQREERRLTSA
jgi:hypothetical protein